MAPTKKVCPTCSQPAGLGATVCPKCAHIFRTRPEDLLKGLEPAPPVPRLGPRLGLLGLGGAVIVILLAAMGAMSLALIGALALGAAIARIVSRARSAQPPPRRSNPRVATPPSRPTTVVQPTPVPIPVAQAPSAPPRPAGCCWVSPGQQVRIHGLVIPGGMVHVGDQLRAVGSNGPDPALINPQLPVDLAHPDRAGTGLAYWPCYSYLSKQCRAAYLMWLAEGRRDPEANIGYVFLFLYGLERRVIVDSCRPGGGPAELSAIIAEVQSLKLSYKSSRSFGRYADDFLTLCALRLGRANAWTTLPDTGGSDTLPIRYRYALGALAMAHTPVPSNLALECIRSNPACRLGTPAKRCPQELRELFGLHYGRHYDDGFTVRPAKTKLSFSYRPASPSFADAIRLDLGVPDAAIPTPTEQKLARLATAACTELEPFSRWMGRHPQDNRPLVQGLLPAELVQSRRKTSLAGLCAVVEAALGPSAQADVPAEDLWAQVGVPCADGIAAADAELLGALLGKLGYGFEPDPRHGPKYPLTGGPLVVFRLPAKSAGEVSPAFSGAVEVMAMAAAVATADGIVSREETAHIEQHIGLAAGLAPDDQRRLSAHLHWLLTARPAIRPARRTLLQRPEDERRAIAHFVLGLASADGAVAPSEVQVLARIHDALGLDSKELYSHIHERSASSAQDPGPVVVRPAPQRRAGHALPARPAKDALNLDPSVIKRLHEDTARASATLRRIAEEAEAAELPSAIDDEVSGGARLDLSHVELLRRLSARPSWLRAEAEILARELGLILDGVLETLNDAAFEVADEPVTEGDDPIDINRDISEVMLK